MSENQKLQEKPEVRRLFIDADCLLLFRFELKNQVEVEQFVCSLFDRSKCDRIVVVKCDVRSDKNENREGRTARNSEIVKQQQKNEYTVTKHYTVD